jgi:eight-cysteine-cluster-containing protein
VSADPLVMNGAVGKPNNCPAKWMRADYMMIHCPDGWGLEARTFGGTDCVRCYPGYRRAEGCRGDWQNADLMFGCAPGYEMVFSVNRECKRCVPVPECVDDADCFRTGCAGEICSNEHMASLCVWQPEFACYEGQHCGCRAGKCGWPDDPALQECLGTAHSTWLDSVPRRSGQ